MANGVPGPFRIAEALMNLADRQKAIAAFAEEGDDVLFELRVAHEALAMVAK